jgi:DNA-binding PadR family transcriptional regulator
MTEHNLPVPDDMPWVNLSQEELEELRNKKHSLTDYGKQQLRKLMTEPLHAKVTDEDFQKIVEAFDNPQPYPEEMLDAARTANKAKNVKRKNGNAK